MSYSNPQELKYDINDYLPQTTQTKNDVVVIEMLKNLFQSSAEKITMSKRKSFC